MEQKSNATLREALTFDDVLLKPGLAELLPSDADIRSRITRDIPLNIPIVASAMDTVAEAKMAIAMEQAGGPGVITPHPDPAEHHDHGRQADKPRPCACSISNAWKGCSWSTISIAASD